MPQTKTPDQTHLALPKEDELEAARRALDDAVATVNHLRFRVTEYSRLEETSRGRGFMLDDDRLCYRTYDVPTLEDIGRLFLFEQDMEHLAELLQWSDQLSKVEWLTVIRGSSGIIAAETLTDA